MKNKGRKLLGVLVLVVLVSAGGWWWLVGPDASDGQSRRTVSRVCRRRFAAAVLATGVIKPQIGAEVKVGARISGCVRRLRANIGDRVAEGQVLAELETEELEAEVAVCRARMAESQARLSAIGAERPKELARAGAVVDEAEAAVRLARLNWQRIKRLHGRNAAAVHEMDTARKELDIALARLAMAKAELKLSEVRFPDDLRIARALVAAKGASLASAKARLAYATIRAPISGVVASVNTQEGETVAAGLNAPTFVTIMDLSRLQADTFVDEVDIGKVKVGQSAAVTVDTFPGRTFEGKVAAIYPKAVIQENVVNYDVVVDISTPYEGLLRPEMTASVTIFLAARDNVLAVPAKAVARSRGRSVVYVPGDKGPERREVKVGWRDGQWVEIVAGLKEGETILLDHPAESPKEGEFTP